MRASTQLRRWLVKLVKSGAENDQVTVMDEPELLVRLAETIGSITVAEIAGGELQEGQDLDFKRGGHVDKPEAKARLLDDVVAFLNRG